MNAAPSRHPKLLVACGLLVASVVAAGSARGAVRPFTSSIAISIVNYTMVLPGSGTAVVNGSSGPGHLTSLELPASAFATTASIQLQTDPAAYPINGFQLTGHNGAGNFSGSGGAGFGGVMPLNGTQKICLYGGCGTSNNITNLTIPLTVVGQGGYTTVMGAVNLTVIGAPWTTATAAIGTPSGYDVTMMGGVSPLSSTNVVTLVTPIFISTNIMSYPIYPSFASMTLTDLFVPEPGTFALLVAGLVSLAGYGRARMRGR